MTKKVLVPVVAKLGTRQQRNKKHLGKRLNNSETGDPVAWVHFAPKHFEEKNGVGKIRFEASISDLNEVELEFLISQGIPITLTDDAKQKLKAKYKEGCLSQEIYDKLGLDK